MWRLKDLVPPPKPKSSYLLDCFEITQWWKRTTSHDIMAAAEGHHHIAGVKLQAPYPHKNVRRLALRFSEKNTMKHRWLTQVSWTQMLQNESTNHRCVNNTSQHNPRLIQVS